VLETVKKQGAMHKKQLMVIGLAVFLAGGCVLMQDKPVDDDLRDVRISGDVTVSTVDR
jgi:hypothetical protein